LNTVLCCDRTAEEANPNLILTSIHSTCDCDEFHYEY
jgi:hypothetical protein